MIYIDQPHSDLTHKLIGCAYRVFNSLGSGLPENVYQAALAIAFRKQGLRCIKECPIEVRYEGEPAGTFYVDFSCEKTVVVEVKAVSVVVPAHVGQLLGYMKTGKFPLGLLLNFGPVRVDVVRKVMSHFLRSA